LLGPLLLNSRYYFQPRAGADRREFSRGSGGPAIKHRPCGKKDSGTESIGHGLKLFITPVDLSFHAHTSVFLFPDLKDL